MGKIYVGQTKLRLQLNTEVELDEASSGIALQIRYKKPGSSTVEYFEAEELVGTTGAIYYDFQENDLDVAGIWTFWAYVIFDDGRAAPGEPVKIKVYEEGD